MSFHVDEFSHHTAEHSMKYRIVAEFTHMFRCASMGAGANEIWNYFPIHQNQIRDVYLVGGWEKVFSTKVDKTTQK